MRLSNRVMSVLMGSVAIGAGALVNFAGDRLLGVRLELFWGVSTFSPLWMVDLFVVPFIAGFVVSMIYGLDGKLLCYLSPIIVRGISYIQMDNYPNLPEGIILLPIEFWVLILLVAIQMAAFGGVIGEVMFKKVYGRSPKHLIYKQSSDKSSEN